MMARLTVGDPHLFIKERRRHMGEFNDLICVTRYCPNCGSEIFCSSDSDRHTVFYVSEDMSDPTNACPRCQFDLFKLPWEVLLVEPGAALDTRLPSHKVQGPKRLTEAVLKKDPEIFRSKAAAKRALRAVGAVVFDLLASGENVRWSGLGSFKIRKRRPRKGRNPQTGEELRIPAKRVVTFSASKALKQGLNG
jgi:DNA-binding protein HU-beta